MASTASCEAYLAVYLRVCGAVASVSRELAALKTIRPPWSEAARSHRNNQLRHSIFSLIRVGCPEFQSDANPPKQLGMERTTPPTEDA